MLTREQLTQARARAREYLDRAGMVLTPEESEKIEVADFGLNELEVTGLELVVYVNTERVCANSAAAGARFTSTWRASQRTARQQRYRQDASKAILSGTKLCCIPASSIRSRPILCTGSRRVMRARLCRSFRRAAATSSISSPIKISSALRSFGEG